MREKERARLNDLGFSSYQQYLESNHWQQFRKLVFKKKEIQRLFKKHNQFVCQFCERVRRLNIHHWTYARLGNERLQDVYLICEKCHDQIHKLQQQEKISLRKATLLYRKTLRDKNYHLQ